MLSSTPVITAQSVTVTCPFPPRWVPELWRWLESPRYPNFNDGSPKTMEEFEKMAKGVLESDLTWAVRINDRVRGYVGFRQYDDYSGMFHGVIMAPEFRRQGLGREAVRQVSEVLNNIGIRSMQAAFYEDNEAIGRMFKSLGWIFINRHEKSEIKRDGKVSPVVVWGSK